LPTAMAHRFTGRVAARQTDRSSDCARLEKVDAFHLCSEGWRGERERVPRQQSTTEFREQAMPRVLEQKVPIPEAARRLTMSGKTLKNWVGRALTTGVRYEWSNTQEEEIASIPLPLF
ncbi:MAG: transposase, partial [Nitrospirota bacterium]